MRRSSWLPVVVVAAASLVIFGVLNPPLIFTANTPTGGDMGAHVYAPAYLRDVLLPSGRILGWSNDWFAGFPVFYFYFPLPSLVIVALDVLLPYGVAFKIVAVAGLLALPPAAYFLARSMRFGQGVAMAAAGASTAFVFMESYSIYGANVASTLAGEFAYGWSFALGFFYLGLLIRAVRDDRRYIPWAAAVLGLTILSHILTTIVLAFASLSVFLWKRSFRPAVTVGLWGGAIAGFWVLPLITRIGYSSDMAWTPLNRWEEIFPIEIWLLLPPAVAGALWAGRRTSRILPLVAATLLPVIYFPLPNILPDLLPELFRDQRWKLWNGRLLPYWYFGVAFFAAVGIGAFATAMARRLPERISAHWPRAIALVAVAVSVGLVRESRAAEWVPYVVGAVGVGLVALSLLWKGRPTSRGVVTATAALALVFGGLAGVTFVDGWARWNFEGYEAKEPYPEYRRLMETVETLPPGRIQWEANRELDKYGTPMSLMLFPYWTGGNHPSMEGLFFESALTTPFHFLNTAEMSRRPSNPIPGLRYRTFDFARGIVHLGVYGVRYYVAYTDEAKAEADRWPELVKIAEAPPFALYRLPPTDLVEVATMQPAVFEPRAAAGDPDAGDRTPTEFGEFALDWYDDISLMDRWVAADGPADWPRVSSLDELPEVPLDPPPAAVSDVVIEPHRISFRTTAVGYPHLVKVSYFPNWTATGADGPWLVTPSLMVVVPTQEEVTLEFRRAWPERLGWLLTVIGVGGLVVWRYRDRFSLRRPVDV